MVDTAQYSYDPVLYRYNQMHGWHGHFAEGGGGGGGGGGALDTGVGDPLSAKGAAAVVDNEQQYGVTQAALQAELESSLNQANLTQGAQWYPNAHQTAAGLGTKYNVSTDQAAGVLAAMSPRTPWPRNVKLADRILSKQGSYPATMSNLDVAHRVGGALSANEAIGVGIARGQSVDSLLTGVKRRSFYNNISEPGRTSSVTVDTWMQRSAMHAATKPMSLDDSLKFLNAHKAITNGAGAGYISISNAVQAVAKAHGVSPDVIQAAYWVAQSGGVLGNHPGGAS